MLVAAGVAVGAMLSGDDAARAPAPVAQPDRTPPPPIAAPSPPPELEAAAPAPITLRIDTSPDGAQVLVDGRSSGTTPAVIELPRSEEPIVLTLRRDGYRDEARTIVPSESQSLELDLTAVSRRSRVRKTVSAMQRSFRRFD